MNSTTADSCDPDPAAIFAAALSTWNACHARARCEPRINLSECFNGMDEFMRCAMRIGELFENWCCLHIDFDQLSEVWPYLLEDKFGSACLNVLSCESLVQFDENDCLRVAMHLRLPIIPDGKLPVPIDVRAPNPVEGSEFHALRIQTVRDVLGENRIAPFTFDDDPFDEEYGTPYFGFYGVDEEGLVEHIADRDTIEDAVKLAKNLVPRIEFLEIPRVHCEGKSDVAS